MSSNSNPGDLMSKQADSVDGAISAVPNKQTGVKGDSSAKARAGFLGNDGVSSAVPVKQTGGGGDSSAKAVSGFPSLTKANGKAICPSTCPSGV